MSMSSMGALYSDLSPTRPPTPGQDGPHPHGLPTITRSAKGPTYTPRPFLSDLLRPHVRDYESMNLALDHLGTYCDHVLRELRLNLHSNVEFTDNFVFQRVKIFMSQLWPLDELINPNLRHALRKFNWRALFDAVVAEEMLIHHYQTDQHIYGPNRRHGAQRWIIYCAAYTDLNTYNFVSYGLDLLRYLDPVATRQAFHVDFDFSVVQHHDITRRDLHWFSRSFFPHWDQAFQLLVARHPERDQQDAHQIFTAFVRQGINVVDVFLKYWYQGKEDDSDDRFGSACEHAAQSAIDRQWKIELDSPFASLGIEPVPLNIRTILARVDHAHSQKTFFNTVAFLAQYIERENMHRELFVLLLGSLKKWAAVTGNEDMVDDLMETVGDDEEVLDNPMRISADEEEPWPGAHVPHSPLSNRPLCTPPVILLYDLPDELPDPPEPEEESFEFSEIDDFDILEGEEFEIRWLQPGRTRGFLSRLNPFHVDGPAPLRELEDVPLEAYGARIATNTYSHACEPPDGGTCAICLESLDRTETKQDDAADDKDTKKGLKANLSNRMHTINITRGYRQAAKEKAGMQPMQLNACIHAFHLACLDALLNQDYPKAGVVRYPNCRVVICPARPTRAVRRGFGRVPFIGRIARP